MLTVCLLLWSIIIPSLTSTEHTTIITPLSWDSLCNALQSTSPNGTESHIVLKIDDLNTTLYANKLCAITLHSKNRSNVTIQCNPRNNSQPPHIVCGDNTDDTGVGCFTVSQTSYFFAFHTRGCAIQMIERPNSGYIHVTAGSGDSMDGGLHVNLQDSLISSPLRKQDLLKTHIILIETVATNYV
eukprot:PhF_6_TR3761/c0_g3_i2/m.5449